MASLFSRLNPVPTFPEYTGPHRVGTVDVEIPVSVLDAPSPTPEGAADVHTVQCRIFYPAVPEAEGSGHKRIPWLPSPQRLQVSAYAQFLGIGPVAASVLSFIPRHLHYVLIPAHKNATLLRPSPDSPSPRWPTVVFSHGLGGNRNTYSHVAGSLASHGVVVVCPEHRDGSAAVSLVRDPKNQDRYFVKNTRHAVPYIRIPHKQTTEIWEARDKQMRIRLWELGLGMEALVAIDNGNEKIIKSNMNASTPEPALSQFSGLLDVQQPGRVIFGGHSFGAATMVQLLKSTYYADVPEVSNMTSPLFVPKKSSAISRQITAKNPAFLLDMWCFPLMSAASAPLFNLPLPVYADDPSAPGGDGVLAIESQAFFKWKENLHMKARILSPEPSNQVVSPTAFGRPTGIKMSEPSFFWVETSAHLSQSDFGILFPWLTKKVFGAEQPERCLRLNTRAQLQFLRNNGYGVARTWVGDLVDGAGGVKEGMTLPVGGDKGIGDGTHNDEAILARDEIGMIEAWKWIDIVGMGGKAGPTELEGLATGADNKEPDGADNGGEREMEGEMEPALAPGAEGKASTTALDAVVDRG
ncbi:platelet-activating factor acetylhydrolase, isoform II-domain-containing protein [Cercophora scortea]|uniref:Putative phospholipase n=1 Tax=Cercophora scortea TaxID=314031 RepID=A0AAE0IP93_9PEZI|nr:platelet-activating factor acetylhydrolase, isoform II-domain-containing protein [Cercophora scortea]